MGNDYSQAGSNASCGKIYCIYFRKLLRVAHFALRQTLKSMSLSMTSRASASLQMTGGHPAVKLFAMHCLEMASKELRLGHLIRYNMQPGKYAMRHVR
jgi:hypothetical protein